LRTLYERYGRKGAIGSNFFTIAYGLIDNDTGKYRVVRGGHTPVLHLDAGGRMHVHYTKGVAVGIMGEAEVVVEEAEGTLSSGDRLIIASDGLIEAFGGEGLLDKALERLSAFADGFRGAKLEDFVDAFRRRSREDNAKRLSRDDVSLLVIERK
jgi:serine phosphatase RsbU (regulator of sigma subunit)